MAKKVRYVDVGKNLHWPKDRGIECRAVGTQRLEPVLLVKSGARRRWAAINQLVDLPHSDQKLLEGISLAVVHGQWPKIVSYAPLP